MYALIINNEKITTGNPPTGARRLDTGAWVTPPKDGWTPDLLAACGWHEVTETPRPADTADGTHTGDVIVVDGLPVRVWTWRAWTVEELAGQEQQAVAATLTADTKTDEQKIEQTITALATLLGDNATTGSLRQWRGAVVNQYSAASQRALADLLITQTQQTRRIARQTLRLVRMATGDYTSADVGGDL